MATFYPLFSKHTLYVLCDLQFPGNLGRNNQASCKHLKDSKVMGDRYWGYAMSKSRQASCLFYAGWYFEFTEALKLSLNSLKTKPEKGNVFLVKLTLFRCQLVEEKWYFIEGMRVWGQTDKVWKWNWYLFRLIDILKIIRQPFRQTCIL